MRVSGYSPSTFSAPRNTDTPDKGGSTSVPAQPDKKGGDSNTISYTSSSPSGVDLSPNKNSNTPDKNSNTPDKNSTTPDKNSTTPDKNVQGGVASFESFLSQIMSFISGAPSSDNIGTTSQGADQTLPSSDSSQSGQVSSSDSSSSDQMSFEQVITTLGQHEKLLGKAQNREGLEKLRDDPDTPSDEKKALDTLLKNPDMLAAIDSAKNGKSDGKISSKDIRTWQENPEIKQYANAKSESYTHDYVPSDAKPGSATREMTANDAMRELYLYSESMPKNINLETLQKIADGSQDMGKCPPQVSAAAKYFTDHPDEWQQFTGKDDPNASVSRDRMCDLASYNVKLSSQENNALDTIKNNEDIFFKGGSINTDKLTKIANNESNSQEVRDAANLLSQPNSMLFSMLDNGKHGAGGNFFNKANDQSIGKGDIDAFIRKGSNQVASSPQYSPPANDPISASAKQDMNAGQETQPDQKKEKGGGIYKLLDALSFLTVLIPGVGAAGLAANIGRVAITTAVKEGVKQGAKEGIKEGAKQGTMDGVKEGVKDGAKEGLKEGAKEGVKEGANQVLTASQSSAAGNQQVESPRVWAQS